VDEISVEIVEVDTAVEESAEKGGAELVVGVSSAEVEKVVLVAEV
jgi:hypothetical protein